MGALDWRTEYERKKQEPETALRALRSGDRVFLGSGCAEPQVLVRTFEELRWEFSDIEFVQFLSMHRPFYADPKFRNQFRLKSFFVASGSRDAVSEGHADYTPMPIRQVPHLLETGALPIRVALIQVSPPDESGACSLGISVDIVRAAAAAAELVIAQVNADMPRTAGDSLIHVRDLDVVVEHTEPVLEARLPAPTDLHRSIARNVASLVEDGSTIAAGWGPSAMQAVRALSQKKDLGIHTDVLHDAFLDLIESGAVTNRFKTTHPGKTVASSCVGSRRLYDYVRGNPDVAFYPTELVNDPAVIGSNERMVSISPAIEVDLTGQVCAESVGYRIFSGIGGYLDFLTGASLSKGGKHIITLPSTAENGARSRIVSHLAEGSGVTVTRASVHYVVTEYGAVNLRGLSLRERAVALIQIAHPKFRERLLAEAKQLRTVYEDQLLPDDSGRPYPHRWETRKTLKDGLQVFFRPIKPTDERGMQELFYSLPKEDVYSRFFSPKKSFSHRDTQVLCNIDYDREMTIVGTVGEPGEEKIVATGRYIREEDSDLAEVDFTVRHDFQGAGIATVLCLYLAEIAQANGVKGFSAYVLTTNQKMLTVLCRLGYQIRTSMGEEGVFRIWLRFDEPSDVCPFNPHA